MARDLLEAQPRDLLAGMPAETQQAPKNQDRSMIDWFADTFGPNGNLRGSVIGGAMKTMAAPAVGGAQLIANAIGRGDAINNAISEKEKEYQDARAAAGRSGFDAGEFVGSILAPTNLIAAAKIPLAASMLGKIGQGAAIGAASGAIDPIADTSGGYWGKKAAQTTAAGVTGAVLTPAIAKGGEALSRAMLKPDPVPKGLAASDAVASIKTALDDIGQKIEDIPPAQLKALFDQVQQSLKAGKTLDVAAALRKADFNELGINPTLGQVTRDPKQWANEMNLRGVTGTGEPLLQRFTEQNAALTKGINALAEGSGERTLAGRKILEDLSSADDFFSKHVSSLYRQARESAGKDLDVPLQGLAQDYARILRDFGDKLPSGVRNNLDELGLLSGNQQKVFTVEDADRLLKVINSNSSNDPATNAALSQIRASVKNAVNSADASGGVFAPAVKAASERFAMHDAIPALRAAAEGSVAPDDFVRRFVIGGKADEVAGLSRILSPESKAEAKAQIGEYLRRAAFGENAAGDKAFSQERFNKAITDLGTDKLKSFFSGAEIEMIKRMGRVGAFMSSAPAKAPVNSSGSAAEMFNLMQHIPGLGRVASAVNTVGKSVVSPVRNNALVRAAMDATPPVTAAPMTEAQSNLLARILAGGAAIGGGLAAPNM